MSPSVFPFPKGKIWKLKWDSMYLGGMMSMKKKETKIAVHSNAK